MGVALHQGTSFPVGKVDHLFIYPMTFDEYLLATELFDEPGLSYLPRALYEQRPASWGVFPGDEVFHGESFHRYPLSMVGRLP